MDASDVVGGLLKLLDVANPLAGTVATFLAGKMGLSDASIDAVKSAVSGVNSADQVKLHQIAADLQDHLTQYGVQAQLTEMQSQASQVEAVNKTLQTEAMGGGWLQRNHHAIESLMAASSVILIYFVLPICRIPSPAVDPMAWVMLGSILGVTAWQRGAANVATAKA